ncbi:ATP-binding protein [Thalassospira sp. TSL5-1]|uniref:ATP-binding protein n=1 Tax=Thalassospira sp. TSL5-1 TaxID=1544451 RepID=UPI0009F9A883|nr:ATP-binding protein [Thalassospira sp. TSL5-1]
MSDGKHDPTDTKHSAAKSGGTASHDIKAAPETPETSQASQISQASNISAPYSSPDVNLSLALLENSDVGIIAVKHDGKICFWNSWMEQAAGLKAEEVFGKSMEDVFGTALPRRLHNAIADCLSLGMPAMISPSLNKSVLPLRPQSQFAQKFPQMQQSIRIQPVSIPNDGVICAITVRDVTLAVQRDQLLRRQAAELADLVTQTRRSEDRTRAILQNTIDAILVASEDGNLEPLNARAQELCGPQGDPEIKNIIQFLLPDCGNNPPPKPPSDRLLTDLGTGVIEILACPANGHNIPLEVAISHFTAYGRYHYIITLRDISQRKRHELEIQNTMQELENSNAELEQFAYAASHDLQEPLRMVSSYTQLLARRYRGQLDDTADEFIHYAVDGTQRMQRMIDDLLTLSRVGRHGKPFQPVPLTGLFDAIEANLKRAEAAPAGNVMREPDLPVVIGDPSQLLQLFQNLVSNGLKYSDPAHAEVRISAREFESFWRISVSDNGIGIDPQYHTSIFEIFKRLHGYGEYAGTGIGLALCKKIVERHGGNIHVESAPGEGSTFHVDLPKEHSIL